MEPLSSFGITLIALTRTSTSPASALAGVADKAAAQTAVIASNFIIFRMGNTLSVTFEQQVGASLKFYFDLAQKRDSKIEKKRPFTDTVVNMP